MRPEMRAALNKLLDQIENDISEAEDLVLEKQALLTELRDEQRRLSRMLRAPLPAVRVKLSAIPLLEALAFADWSTIPELRERIAGEDCGVLGVRLHHMKKKGWVRSKGPRGGYQYAILKAGRKALAKLEKEKEKEETEDQ
jgi:hypothetical protein